MVDTYVVCRRVGNLVDIGLVCTRAIKGDICFGLEKNKQKTGNLVLACTQVRNIDRIFVCWGVKIVDISKAITWTLFYGASLYA